MPISSKTTSNTISYPFPKSSIFYVGGSGPNNYSKIQDAVNNATNGDIIFVFDDSSPYYENVVVGKSITIQGENKNSTVLIGRNHTYGVNITVDAVSIVGFTIQNFSNGIYITSNNNQISNNIFRENYNGIMIDYDNLSSSVPPHLGHNTFMNNFFINNSNSLIGLSGWNNTVESNMISQSFCGIFMGTSVNTITSLNHFYENKIGVVILGSYNTKVTHNNFSANELGVFTYLTSADKILQNNFIRNNWSALSHQRLLANIRHLKINLGFPIHRNVWDGNYWNEPRSLPYMIPGVIMKAIFKVDFGFQIDWHPAKQPYDIP